MPNGLIVEYYRQRASAGLIISKGVPVSDRARGCLNTPALWNEQQAAGWQQLIEAVHAAGGRMFAHAAKLALQAGLKVWKFTAPMATCSINFPVRQSPYGLGNDMIADPEPLKTYPWLASELNRRGIGFLHIYCQSADWIHDATHSVMPALRDAFHSPSGRRGRYAPRHGVLGFRLEIALQADPDAPAYLKAMMV